jgi:hypothetical protein
MNDILGTFVRKFVLVFVDDILIYCTTLANHANHLETVLGILQQHDLNVKKSKCTFAKQEIFYLGHVISSAGVSNDKTKIALILKWQQPQNVKDLKSILCMIGC